MQSGFKYTLAALLAAGWVVVVIEWMALRHAREENRALAARIASSVQQGGRELASTQAESEELSELRRENKEIFRLRNEVTQLRATKEELERLQAENQKLQDTLAFEKERIQTQWAAWVSALKTNGMKPDDVFALTQALTNDATTVRLEATRSEERRVGK